MIPASEALTRLREGNKRFVAGESDISSRHYPHLRAKLSEKQEPFAIVLGCSDSRVPSELVFDQALGELFVVRVAGNVAAPSQVASIEFCAEHLGSRLVVVLGHTGCGAVKATIDGLRLPQPGGENLAVLVDRIKPAVEPLLQTELADQPEALMREAVRANARSCVDHLQHNSEILARLARTDGLSIIGAEYSLATGEVEFFDDDNANQSA